MLYSVVDREKDRKVAGREGSCRQTEKLQAGSGIG